MNEPSQRDEGFLRQILLQEYANAIQLYTTTIEVTFMRIYGLLALHGGLIVGFFIVTSQCHRWFISIAGFVFALLTLAINEHIWQVSLFRITTIREIEKKLNRLMPDNMKPDLKIFNDQKILLIDKGEVTFPLLNNERLPKTILARSLIKVLPHQADRSIPYYLIILWALVVIFFCLKLFN